MLVVEAHLLYLHAALQRMPAQSRKQERSLDLALSVIKGETQERLSLSLGCGMTTPTS